MVGDLDVCRLGGVGIYDCGIGAPIILQMTVYHGHGHIEKFVFFLTLEKYGLLKDMQVEKEFLSNGGILGGHPDRLNQYGIEISSGSLGYGLSIGSGVALSAKKNNRESRAFILLGDGECNEGSVWEAAMLAPAQNLDNLVAVVDFNSWQATGRSQEVTSISLLKDKFEAFGWSSFDVDGHDINALAGVLEKVPNSSGRPVAVIAHTVKGKGISFMEDDNNWHYRIPNEEEVKASLMELGLS